MTQKVPVRNFTDWNGEPFWSEQRRVFVTELTDRHWVAEGVYPPAETSIFKVRGELKDLARFTSQMAREGATVVIGPRPLKDADSHSTQSHEQAGLPLTGNITDPPPSPVEPKGGDKANHQTLHMP